MKSGWMVCVLVLVLGCSDGEGVAGDGGVAGEGGNGGGAGTAGDGGNGGSDLCERVICFDDRNECTAGDGVCDPADGECKYPPVGDGTECDARNECTAGQCAEGACEEAPLADGTPCDGSAGACQDGHCVADCEGSVCPCSEAGIRGAIAEGGGPFTFDCNGLTTVVTVEEIVIDNDIVLDGEGILTVHGDDDHRVFALPFGVTVELDGIAVTGGRDGGIHMDVARLTLTNSTVSGNTEGGIHSQAGNLTLTNSTVSGNTGIGISSGGGTLTVTNSTVSGNTGRGILSGITTLTVTNSTVSGNTDGGIFHEPSLSGRRCTLTNSTVSGNTATATGGGILGSCTLTNSTVSGNTAANGGGIFTRAPEEFFLGHYVTLTNSTVSGNTATRHGGGIANEGSCTLTNSTVSGNTATETGDGIWNIGVLTLTNSLVGGECTLETDPFRTSVTSNGHNIESPGDTCGFDQPTDQVNVSVDNLRLGLLQDNGGLTETHALGAGSFAIDVIPEAECVDADGEPLTTDQRGEPRPGGTMCDIGAFEVQP